MRQYNLTPPQRKNYCVPSCLQAILRKHNAEVSQDKIANVLIKKENGFIPEGKMLEEFLKQKELLYNFYWYNKTPFNEPDSLLEFNPNKDILIGLDEHCFLCLDYQENRIILLNPNDISMKEINHHDILKRMHEAKSGFFGLMSRIKNQL
ncbi:MAG: hypothetical protein ABH804_01655 [archaeon]